MISSLGGVIMETKPLKGDMEAFVAKFVLPELQAPQGYMRHIVRGSYFSCDGVQA